MNASDEIRELTDLDRSNIIAHLSPELCPIGDLPSRNSVMMDWVHQRNDIADRDREIARLTKERDDARNEAFVRGQERDAQMGKVASLQALLNRWLDVADNCSIESGVCGCGADMDNHPHDNHGPSDGGAYVAMKLTEETKTAIERSKP